MVNCHEDIFQARGTIWPARLNMADIRNGGNGGLWFWRGTAVHELNATDWMACLDEYSEIKDLQVESDDYWAIVYEKLYWVRRRLYRWPLLSFPYVDHEREACSHEAPETRPTTRVKRPRQHRLS
eukprot:COSAG05_NODE_1847_length_3968_cov_9.225381_1_plen_125_part_00